MPDKRFEIIKNDPRFRKIPKRERKVKIDSRFKSMFTDEKFKVKYQIDKRGRPSTQSSSENFKKFYDLPSSEDEDSDESCESNESLSGQQSESCELKGSESKLKLKSALKINKTRDSGKDSEDSSEENVEEDVSSFLSKKEKKKGLSENVKEKLQDLNVDYARGELALFSDESSSDEESSESCVSETDEIDHKWGELDKDAEIAEEISSRLAVCNMDWDRIRAVDLMVLFNSLLTNTATVKCVTIYPSEFGIERMKEEEAKGPAELLLEKPESAGNTEIDDDDVDDQTEEGSRYNKERMRQYQLNRLRYYYAIVEFDCAETANKVYTECDGLEYESSGTKFDLRFVPDGMTFDQEPKERCDALPNFSKYQPRFFTTTALQQAKVDLTWDETDPKRTEFAQKVTEAAKNGDVDDSDIENYVALSSSDEDGDSEENEKEMSEKSKMNAETLENEGGAKSERKNKNSISLYRQLLKEIEEKERNSENNKPKLEVTWGGGGGKSEEDVDSNEEGWEEEQEEVKKEVREETLTPFEKILQKRKEKRRKRLDGKLKTNRHSDDFGESEDTSSDEIVKKGKSQKVLKGESNLKDDECEKKNAELELLLMEDAKDDKKHFNLNEIEQNGKKKNKRKFKKKLKEQKPEEDLDNFQVDVKDERFSALYSSHLFNIDPADSKFRKTKGMQAFVEEKQKRRIKNDSLEEPKSKIEKLDRVRDQELLSLVQSVKRKTINQKLIPIRK